MKGYWRLLAIVVLAAMVVAIVMAAKGQSVDRPTEYQANQHTPTRTAKLPEGLHPQEQTREIGRNRQGWTLIGSGHCQPANASPWYVGLRRGCTVLTWHGSRGGTMLVAGGAGWRIADITLLGWQSEQSRFKPGCNVGVQVINPKGLNGAKALIERASFAGFDAAILIGQRDANPPGNDNLRLSQITAHHCGAMVEIASPQACSTVVEGWHTRKVDSVVLASGGGDITLRDGDCGNDGTLLKVTGDGTQTGSNNQRFTFDGFKVDTTANSGTLTLVDAAHRSPKSRVQAVFRDGAFPASRTKVRIVLGSDTHKVLLTNCHNVPAIEVEAPSKGQVMLSNCWRSNGEFVHWEEL